MSSGKNFTKHQSLIAPSNKLNDNNKPNTKFATHKSASNLTTAANAGRLSSISRAEKSLTALTTKFMNLLQESHNGVLDLRSVSVIAFFSSL